MGYNPSTSRLNLELIPIFIVLNQNPDKMKNKILLLVILFISLTANAQIRKGAILLGGQFSYASENVKYTNSNPKADRGTVNLLLGYAYKTNNVIGISFSYLNHTETNDSYPDTSMLKENTVNIGAFYRLYK